jgi:hypothetical protein
MPALPPASLIIGANSFPPSRNSVAIPSPGSEVPTQRRYCHIHRHIENMRVDLEKKYHDASGQGVPALP